MKSSTVILLPYYNDQLSLDILLQKFEELFGNQSAAEYLVLVVNDGSIDDIHLPDPVSFRIQLLPLYRNIGHQKAIAIGLAYIHHHITCDRVLIMDCDGEDTPEDALSLLKVAEAQPTKIILAHRKSRQEGILFRFFYSFYKFLFKWLTGHKIAFGNFMVLPRQRLSQLVYHSEIWNHLSAGVLKSGFEFVPVRISRGKRYAGESKMSFHSLLLHGLGAISVFLERVASRLLFLSSLLIFVSVVAIIIIICIRSFTSLAIPGWASSVLSAMFIVLLQGFLLSLFTIFLFLSSQSQKKFIPAHHYQDYTSNV